MENKFVQKISIDDFKVDPSLLEMDGTEKWTYGGSFKGCTHTEETKKLISENRSGIPVSDKHKKVLSEKAKEQWASGVMDNRITILTDKERKNRSERSKILHKKMIENDWHRNGPGN